MFTPAMQSIAQWDRPSMYHRALLACLSMLDTQQWRALSARELAEVTGLSVISCTRALAMLEADGLIQHQGATAARRRRLNNRLCWTSRADAHAAVALDAQPEDARGR